MSRGLLVDQFGVDQGRNTMGWLLAALPDPLWSQLQRRRVGLKPYARLASGPWIAANCAYLKDCDYLEGRLKSAGVTTTTPKGISRQRATPATRTSREGLRDVLARPARRATPLPEACMFGGESGALLLRAARRPHEFTSF